MRRKVTLLLIALSLALNIAFVAVWVIHVLPPMTRRGEAAATEGIWCPLHRKLGATKEQWREIEPRLAEFQDATRAVREDINQSRDELISLLAEPDPDMEAIRARRDGILDGHRRMQELVIKHLLAEKQVLTPAQREDLFRMLRQRSAGCADCRGLRLMNSTQEREKP